MGDLTWSWDYFFVPQNQPTPAGTGFGTFSAIHVGVLALLAVGIAALALGYRRADPEGRRRLRLWVGWSVLMLEVLRQLAYVVTGTYSPEILPLHICAIATFAVFIDALWPNRWTGDFLYAMGWWGALAANLFPDWANRPILNVFTWQSFTIHGLIVGYVLMRLVAGDLVPDAGNLARVALVVVVFGTVAFLANAVWGTNFWFLNVGAAGSPLEGIQVLAGSLYVPVLIVAVVILWAVLYLPWVVRARRSPAAPVVRAL
nr:TIGR02206 family membrane protein [Propionibacterium sp.]